ncbi:MAG: hypothetical protein IJF33_06790 [Clostridia bacterium]|nr:hypothetical protein [Clostridia bacterium]
MKTKEEILLAMKMCSGDTGTCKLCPYHGQCENLSCVDVMMRDAMALIEGT